MPCRSVVLKAFKRMFSRSKEGSSVSANEAELRLKALKARLAKNKSEAKRVYSELEKTKNLSADRKAEGKARLRALEAERKDIVSEMKGMRRRLPKH